MAYTSPRTWVTSELVTAALMNTHIRDNITYLYTQIAAQFMLSAAGGRPATTDGCGGAAQVEFGTNDVDIVSCSFDPTSKEYLAFTLPMPADYDGGTVTAVFYWYCTDASTNVCRWQLDARALGNSDAIDGAWGTAGTADDANTAANQLNISTATGAITIANTPVAGDMVNWRVQRGAGAGADTLAFDSEFLYAVITYTRT